MTFLRLTFAALAAALLTMPLLTTPVLADDVTLGGIVIEHPWARATAEAAPTGIVYLALHNQGRTADRLVALSSPVAARVELHADIMDNGVMEMRPVAAVDLAANATVRLAPGGVHAMLIGLTAPLKKGATFPVTLTFESAGTITVQVTVQGAGDLAPAP